MWDDRERPQRDLEDNGRRDGGAVHVLYSVFERIDCIYVRVCDGGEERKRRHHHKPKREKATYLGVRLLRDTQGTPTQKERGRAQTDRPPQNREREENDCVCDGAEERAKQQNQPLCVVRGRGGSTQRGDSIDTGTNGATTRGAGNGKPGWGERASRPEIWATKGLLRAPSRLYHTTIRIPIETR